jgi:two-component system sensor histidine kinase EvgS
MDAVRENSHRIVASRVLLLAFALLGSVANAKPVFTEVEEQWIREQRTVRYAIDPAWRPLEYIRWGQHIGLTKDYLAKLSEMTGLNFEFVPTSSWQESLDALAAGQVDLLPGVPQEFSTDSQSTLLYSAAYYTGHTLVITPANTLVIHELDKLNGATVAVRGGGIYERWLRSRYPDIQLRTFESSGSAMNAVAEGHADAAIGVDAMMHPLVRQRYLGSLHIAGVIPKLPIVMRMAVRSDSSILRDILDKSLNALTAAENDQIYARWLEEADYGAPSVTALLRYYGREMLLAGAVLFVALFAAYQAMRAQEAARRSERQKSMFLAMMSHEIRNPMNAVLSSIELLGAAQLGEHERKLLEVAGTASDQLFKLLSDILDYSRLEAKKLELTPVPTDVLAVLRESIAMIEHTAAKKGLSTPLIAPQSLPTVCVDALRIGQVVSNLLSNAVKFTSAGSVETRVDLQVGALIDGPPILVIEVCDTGIGMPQAVLENIFQPFVQASSDISRRYGGSGLGLSICRALIEMMGGRIGLRSREGEGTIVTVSIPATLSNESENQHGSVRIESREDVSPILGAALIIEDDPSNQLVLSAQLSYLGVSSHVRTCGESGLIAFREGDYVAVFLDCQLPGLDGYETARKMRLHETAEGLPHTPILAISAAVGAEHRRRCLESGMNVVLAKPLGLTELRDVLRNELHLQVQIASRPSQLLARLNDTFVSTVAADLAKLEGALEEDEYSRCAMLAHRIKGAALVAHVGVLAELARQIELAAPNRSAVQLQALAVQMRTALNRMRRAAAPATCEHGPIS